MMDELLEMDPNLEMEENEMMGEEQYSMSSSHTMSPRDHSHSTPMMSMSEQNSID